MNILIVEDEFLLAAALEDCLSRAGHHVVGLARSGAEAVKHAAGSHPDLALIDIRLTGGESGIAVAAELQETMGIPVLYASGQVDEAEESGFGLGILRKPYSEGDVLRSLEVIKERCEGHGPAPMPSNLTLFERAP